MDRKIACETLSDGEKPAEEDSGQPEVPPDFPPESYWLSKDAEFDWFDRNAFFERKESTKGSNSTNLNPNVNPSSNSNSQRFSMNFKSKAAIIGLPKPQKTYVDTKNRKNCKVAKMHLFPKRSGSSGKSDAPMVEPSSPKVSCMGRVRSKRDRKRRMMRKNRHRQSEPVKDKAVPKERRRMGFLASFRAIFRSGGRHKRTYENQSIAADLSESPPRDSVASRSREFSAFDIHVPSSDSLARKSVESESPSLGDMNRFASGRRSESWAVEAGRGMI